MLSACEPVHLALSQVLAEPGKPARHVYFPCKSFVSLLAQTPQHNDLEVYMVGREGMLGAQMALGVSTAPLRAVVQGEGMALRLGTTAFRAELKRSTALQRVVYRYLYLLMGQLAASAACVHYHLIGQRMARWLLMSQDRAQANSFHVTHEFLAYMLGVRRVGITTAAGPLQKSGLIAYHRGELTVLDRAGLERAACGCYAADQLAYRQVLGVPE
jgi:CRP-like cAMP-binding protein